MEFFLYSLFFAFICLDKKHAFQFSISQPLITSSFIGFFLDAFIPAMYFGLLVQLLWLGNLPFGASKTPEGNIASIVGCMLYVEYHELYAIHGQFILFVLFIYTVAISFAASKTETYMRNINIHLFDYAYDSIRIESSPNIGKVVFTALGIQLLANWILILTTLFLGKFVLQNLYNYLSADLSSIWQFVEIAIWATGIGLVISVYKDIKLKKIILGIAIITFITIRVI